MHSSFVNVLNGHHDTISDLTLTVLLARAPSLLKHNFCRWLFLVKQN